MDDHQTAETAKLSPTGWLMVPNVVVVVAENSEIECCPCVVSSSV